MMATMAPKKVLVKYLSVNISIPNFSSQACQTAEIWIIFLVTIFATRKAGAQLSNILSCWKDQHGHLDNMNIKIHP